MKHLAILALLVALVRSAPVSNDTSSKEDILTITGEFFPDELKIYTAEHEIIDLVLPLNNLNFEDDNEDTVIFFVEADVENGIEYKGLNVYKNGNVTKILSTGTSIAVVLGESKSVYFGATNGLYQYNEKKNTAEKYGSIADSIIDIAKENGTDLIYILTDKNELYKVIENGEKKEKVADVVGAKQIVLDLSNNLYYFGQDKSPYVVNDDGTKKIEGLPSNVTDIKLLNPAFMIKDGIPVILDDKAYMIYANGSSDFFEIEFNVKPSAYSVEGTLIQYHAYNKSIYEYNILALILKDAINILSTYLSDMDNEIQEIATRSLI